MADFAFSNESTSDPLTDARGPVRDSQGRLAAGEGLGTELKICKYSRISKSEAHFPGQRGQRISKLQKEGTQEGRQDILMRFWLLAGKLWF